MDSRIHSTILTFLIMAMLFPLSGNALAQQGVIADHTSVAQFDEIPPDMFQTIQDEYRIFYGHTSHGSQIVSGLEILANMDPSMYQAPHFHELSRDLGHNGDTSWVQPTRNWLDANPDCNMVIWSWCGGASDNTEQGIATYLETMTQLEMDYPAVAFVYMTGHLDGSGPDGNLYQRNNQIRDYCVANDKILFDFADIESWDPDGNYYPNDDDECGWCQDWCANHECLSCSYCAHSHCFNCFQKGKAFWTMVAEMEGLETSAVQDTPSYQTVNIRNHPNPFNPQTTVHFDLPRDQNVEMRIVNMDGRTVRTLIQGPMVAGPHSAVWDGRDAQGRNLATGLYLVQLKLETVEFTHKITLIK